MEWGLFFQAAGVGATVLGIVAGAFYWLWAQIGRVRDDAEKDVAQVRGEASLRAEAAQALANVVARELADHKLHVAQTYITRQGMREVTDQIMEAIGGLGSQISSMNGRIDRMLERPAPRRTTGMS